MGGDPEPRDDRFLGGAFPIRGCNNQLVGFGHLQILSLRPHGRMSSGLARTGLDAVGADATGAVLYAQPLADTNHHPRCDGAIALRGLANLAWMAHIRIRYVVAGDGRYSRFPGPWSHHARLLCHLLSRRPLAA